MRKLRPKILVPQHTRPIEGSDTIMEILTAYRDAIQMVHDQTVRYMNKGLYPDEITQLVQLPPHLANHPYLVEYYGTVEWSVKAVFCNYMGWFSGKASELHPLERIEQCLALIDLANGPENTLAKMQTAYGAGKYQWALQLADALIDTDNSVSKAKVCFF
jgi:alkyl sulfatase BDS1-like metallo-beta-lactamase superfamily hydrolase